MQRWLEQGAEFACEVKTVKDGLLARRLENLVGNMDGISMAVRHNKKRSNGVRMDALEGRIKEIVKKFQWIPRSLRYMI